MRKIDLNTLNGVLTDYEFPTYFWRGRKFWSNSFRLKSIYFNIDNFKITGWD